MTLLPGRSYGGSSQCSMSKGIPQILLILACLAKASQRRRVKVPSDLCIVLAATQLVFE